MRKYIKSKSGNLVYTIERQSFSETFRIPENYFQHATRAAWYSVNAGFNVFVQYKGTFYMIDRTEAHGYITGIEFTVITAEEAAAAKMERAAQAMSEAQEHEAKTAAAALDYNTETAEAEAREARFAADYAEILARESAELAAEAGTSNAASIADATAEYAERARRYATSAEETAEQNAAEDEPEPDEITQYMRRQAFGDYSHADATTREEMEAAALKFAAQEQTRLVALWQEAGARQARERYEADEATARDLMNLQDAGAITAEDVASYYQRHGWTPRKYHRN